MIFCYSMTLKRIRDSALAAKRQKNKMLRETNEFEF